jgi:hypothetical protein
MDLGPEDHLPDGKVKLSAALLHLAGAMAAAFGIHLPRRCTDRDRGDRRAPERGALLQRTQHRPRRAARGEGARGVTARISPRRPSAKRHELEQNIVISRIDRRPLIKIAANAP